MNVLRQIWRWLLFHFDPSKKTIRKLARLCLKQGDVAIDCGANVGDITEILSRRGATVHAFEPNPHAFAALKERFADRPNVVCHHEAVWIEEGTLRLYYHHNAPSDPIFWSTGSSLIEAKSNVSRDEFVDVRSIDLADFIAGAGNRIRVLKMDIEGAECRVLRHLLDRNVLGSIEHVFVETHETGIPSLAAETESLRGEVREKGLHHVDLDWK